MQWSDDYRIGEPTLDNDHSQLFKILDECRRALSRLDAAQVLHPLLDTAFEHAEGHFQREEALMRQAEYPDAEGHAGIHRSFLGQLALIRREIGAEGPGLAFLYEYLHRWIAGHILISDRKFGEFLDRRSVAAAE